MNWRRATLATALLLLPTVPVVAAPTAEIQEQRLRNRLDLWANYSGRTKNLVARYTLTRKSSLVEEPLVTTGSIVFIAPDRLVFRDDGLAGSMTTIEGGAISIKLSSTGAAAPLVLQPGQIAAADWLRDRMVRLFAPGDGTRLVDGCRTNVPRGAGYRLDLMPPRASSVRKLVRSVTLDLDPVAGAVVKVQISEAQGDLVELSLSDHRQNVDKQTLADALGERAVTGPPRPGED